MRRRAPSPLLPRDRARRWPARRLRRQVREHRARSPAIGAKGTEPQAAQDLGFPAFATKNTTRVGGADPIADAAGGRAGGVSRGARRTRPHGGRARGLAATGSAAIAAVRADGPAASAPRSCFSDGADLPAATADALERAGARPAPRPAGGAQVIRIGDVAAAERPARPTDGRAAPTRSRWRRAIDRLQRGRRGTAVGRVVVVASGERPSSRCRPPPGRPSRGDPVLFVTRDTIPPRRREPRSRAHQQPKIYLLGPPSVISDKVLDAAAASSARSSAIARPRPGRQRDRLRALHATAASAGASSIPGHGLVFANAGAPARRRRRRAAVGERHLRPAAARRRRRATLPAALSDYLLDIQPGYAKDPVRGVYNHGWIIGDECAISVGARRRSTSCSRSRPSTAEEPRAMSEAEHPDRLAPRPRGHRRGRAPADGRLDPPLRAAAAQPHRAADRGPARRPPGAHRGRARDRAARRALGSHGEMRGHEARTGIGTAAVAERRHRRRALRRAARASRLAPPARAGARAAAARARRAAGRSASARGYLDLLGAAGAGADRDGARPDAHPRRAARLRALVAARRSAALARASLGPAMARRAPDRAAAAGPAPGDGVLDVACGPGNFTRDFARVVGPAGLVVGIDASATMLARAVRDTPAREPGNSPTCAATRSRCPSATRASTRSAASPRCTSSRTRCAALDHMTRVLTPGGRSRSSRAAAALGARCGASTRSLARARAAHLRARRDHGALAARLRGRAPADQRAGAVRRGKAGTVSEQAPRPEGIPGVGFRGAVRGRRLRREAAGADCASARASSSSARSSTSAAAAARRSTSSCATATARCPARCGATTSRSSAPPPTRRRRRADRRRRRAGLLPRHAARRRRRSRSRSPALRVAGRGRPARPARRLRKSWPPRACSSRRSALRAPGAAAHDRRRDRRGRQGPRRRPRRAAPARLGRPAGLGVRARAGPPRRAADHAGAAGPRGDRRGRGDRRRPRRRLARRPVRVLRRDAVPDRRAAARAGDRVGRPPHRPDADRRRRGGRAARRRRMPPRPPCRCTASRRARGVGALRARLAAPRAPAVVERARPLAQLSRAPAEHVARHRARLHQWLREIRASAGGAAATAARATSRTRAVVLARKVGAAARRRREARARAGSTRSRPRSPPTTPSACRARLCGRRRRRRANRRHDAEAARAARDVRLFFADADVRCDDPEDER